MYEDRHTPPLPPRRFVRRMAGPVDPLHSNGGKVFAGIFALYAGVVFLVVAGLFLVPVIHRIAHLFHFEGGPGGPGGPR